MKILNYKQFESKSTLYFGDSEEFNQVKLKHRISDEIIKDYFSDVIDSDFQIEIICGLGELTGTKPEEFELNYVLRMTKYFKNPLDINKQKSSTNQYIKYLKNVSDSIKSVEDCTELIKTAEDLKIVSSEIVQIPFLGAGNSTKENGEIYIVVKLSQRVVSDDLSIARNKFQNSMTPIKVAYEKVITMLDKAGVIRAREIVDTNNYTNDGGRPSTMFGFLTDDEIIVIAEFTDPHPGLQIDDEEFKRAVDSYHKGYCNDLLN
jgi:hypothetical protein